MCFGASIHNLSAYQIKFFTELEEKENMCLHIVCALSSSHYYFTRYCSVSFSVHEVLRWTQLLLNNEAYTKLAQIWFW